MGGTIVCSSLYDLGICARGKTCKYIHNPSNIALCKEFLKNQCPNPNCPLSHKPTQFNSPACKFYLNGFCSNANCLFTHKRETNDKKICRNFSIGGFCRLGKYCPLKHNFNCPDFVERHNCPRGKSCTLVHFLDGSNSSGKMDVVRNEDNDPKGINYHAQQQPVMFAVDSSDEEDDEEEDGTIIEQESEIPNNESDENLIDISDSEDLEKVSLLQTGDDGEELQENKDYVKL